MGLDFNDVPKSDATFVCAFFPTLYSENVFHSPQAGHLPIHLGLSYPHALHTYIILSFAIIVLFAHKGKKNSLTPNFQPLTFYTFVPKFSTFMLRYASKILLLTLCLSICHQLRAAQPDSIWHDAITGVRIHLQRPDTLTPPTCPFHIFGRDTTSRPPTLKSPALQALTEDLAINALVLSWDYFATNRSWARISKGVIKDHLTNGWVWDNDSYSGNQFSHPYHGGMFYNAAREHGLSYGVSLLYPVIGSLTWELFCETNRPAINDLLSTGIGGAAIGEITHRTSDIFFDNTQTGFRRVVREIFGTALNPVRGIHRMFSGEMFRVNRLYAGKKEAPEPYSFQVGIGDRFIYDVGAIHHNTLQRYKHHIPYLDFHFTYGNHYNNLELGKATRAFDYFDLYALVNLSSNNPTVGELDLRGRIGSIQRQLPHEWKLDIGFYQNLRLIDHYSNADNQAPGNLALISEAASFGAGFHAERHGSAVSLHHDLMLSAVPLGGCASDYYPLRRYNFGTGFSVQHKFEMFHNRRLSFGNDFYFMRLFIIRGIDRAKLQSYYEDPVRYREQIEEGVNAWGDQGQQSVLRNRLHFNVHITSNTQFHLMHEFNLRHGRYQHYPSLTAKSHEWKAGISYDL